MFENYVRCTNHGTTDLRKYDVAPKLRCTFCEKLPEGQRGKLQKRKMRTYECEQFDDFIGKHSKCGTYYRSIRKMFSHLHRVIILGKNFKKKYRYEFAKRGDLILKIERDFAERWSASANRQRQFEYFNKDTSLEMEGMSVFFKPKGQDEYETRFYSILSTEKAQDGRVVYFNTRIMLDDLKSIWRMALKL